jgi:hypothetical protein
MTDIESRLLNYDELPASERDEVDAYLAEHPEAADVLAEGRTLRALLEEAGRLDAEVPDAEAVAQFIAAQHMAQRPLPDDLAALGRRIEAAFEDHPEVERQYSMMQERLKTLVTNAESPRAQFERLTGRSLGTSRGADPSPAQETPATMAAVQAASRPAPQVRRDRSKTWRTSVTDSLSLVQSYSLPRLAFAATFIVVLLYGGLYIASRAGQPEHVRLADLDTVENEFAGLRLRGPDGQIDLAADRYAAALDALREARSSTLGLFPHYETEGLNVAIQLLEEAADLEGQDSALGLEAWFLIGKILLYEGETDLARDAFQIVVEQQGPSAPDAQRLLYEIDTAPDATE